MLLKLYSLQLDFFCVGIYWLLIIDYLVLWLLWQFSQTLRVMRFMKCLWRRKMTRVWEFLLLAAVLQPARVKRKKKQLHSYKPNSFALTDSTDSSEIIFLISFSMPSAFIYLTFCRWFRGFCEECHPGQCRRAVWEYHGPWQNNSSRPLITF